MRKGFLSAFFVLSAVALLLFIRVSSTQAQPNDSKQKKKAPEFKKGEAIVKLKVPGEQESGEVQAIGANLISHPVITPAMQLHYLYSTIGKDYRLTIKPLETDDSTVKIKVEDDQDQDAVMKRLMSDLQKNSAVDYAEPNWIYHAIDTVPNSFDNLRAQGAVVPNDPAFFLDWGLLNLGQRDNRGQYGKSGSDIGATRAWNSGTGSHDITVAVIDTGIDYDHEDLDTNIYINKREIPDNKIDDDRNGFVDDVHGWNFEGKNNNPFDDNRHGTHCAGTIGAKGNNGRGTAGVAWKVRMMPVKFLSASGSGSLADALESINYSTKMKVNIMSNSWGGGGYSRALYNAIKKARDAGILFVAAAGNESNDNDIQASYPSGYQLDNVIAVAATDNRDQIARFSSYGQNTVHLSAPGVNVFSTVPKNMGSYDTFSGTSMATPHVSGAAALLWSLHRKMSYREIKARLLSTVDPIRVLRRKTSTGGRLNIYNAIHNIVPPRNEPATDLWKGFIRDIETKHPYADKEKITYEIRHPGAKFIRVHFVKLDTERGYDIIRIRDRYGDIVEELSGDMIDYYSEFVDGDTLKISLESDASVSGFGFLIDKYEYID